MAAYRRLAQQKGAKIFANTAVTRIAPHAHSVTLETSAGLVEAGQVIITAGPWMAAKWLEDILPALKPRLTLTRQTTAWFQPLHPERLANMPVFAFEVAKDEIVYGFPPLSGKGVKVASHVAGPTIDHPDDPVTPSDGAPPLEAFFAERIAPLKAFLREYVPDALGPMTDRNTCIYTNTHDGRFLIDRHPSYPHIVFASACSGHGFKFASILGPILADIAQRDDTRFEQLDIGQFAL
jgi:sarcosine oxidase